MDPSQSYTNQFEGYDDTMPTTASSHADLAGFDMDLSLDGTFDSSPFLLTDADIMQYSNAFSAAPASFTTQDPTFLQADMDANANQIADWSPFPNPDEALMQPFTGGSSFMPTQDPFADSAFAQGIFIDADPGLQGTIDSSPFALQHETFMHQDLSAACGQPNLALNDQPLPIQAGGGHLEARGGAPPIAPATDTDTPPQWSCAWHEPCPRIFTRLPDMERHVKNVHIKDEEWWCPIPTCARSFTRGRDLQGRRRGPFPRKDKRDEHVRKVHGEDAMEE
ncbi:hypothetical protein BU16DRAFT_615392 [Lophium mytilinum]|uniref:C2H2-type domain-containing protein n=1 Tax=Lophium mytilinum TaxID=390894 RepID=A0A6A6R0U2_9PEZI|nr:hypothetical protein BU16DRAFT_615392 [Lophium mytilinum]